MEIGVHGQAFLGVQQNVAQVLVDEQGYVTTLQLRMGDYLAQETIQKIKSVKLKNVQLTVAFLNGLPGVSVIIHAGKVKKNVQEHLIALQSNMVEMIVLVKLMKLLIVKIPTHVQSMEDTLFGANGQNALKNVVVELNIVKEIVPTPNLKMGERTVQCKVWGQQVKRCNVIQDVVQLTEACQNGLLGDSVTSHAEMVQKLGHVNVIPQNQCAMAKTAHLLDRYIKRHHVLQLWLIALLLETGHHGEIGALVPKLVGTGVYKHVTDHAPTLLLCTMGRVVPGQIQM